MLSRFVIVFLPRSKCLLISWLQSFSAVALAAAPAKSLQSCPTLCGPIDSSLPGSPIPGILQARTLEWVAISFSSAWKWKVKAKSLSCVWLLATPWTAAYQAPLSVAFSRQEYWSGVPLPSLGIPVELFQILKDDAVKVLHSVCQQIWKTQQWPATGLEKVSFHSNPKERQCQRMLKLPHNCTHLTR